MALDFVAGCVGGCAGILVGHPLDTLKVNLQTQDLRNPLYRGSIHCFTTIVQREGVRGLYRGMGAPLCGVAAVNAVTFGVYGAVQRQAGSESARAHFACGAVSGLVQSMVCAPLELLKTRGQVLGVAPLECVAAVVRQDGLRGVFRGLCATAARDTPAMGIYFATYEALTRGDAPASTAKVLLSGGLAGAASWFFTYPLDVLKSRLQMDGASGAPRRYSGMVDCLRQSVRSEGWSCLTRGLSTVMVRSMPTNAACFYAVTFVLSWDRQRASLPATADVGGAVEVSPSVGWHRRGLDALDEVLGWRRNLSQMAQCDYLEQAVSSPPGLGARLVEQPPGAAILRDDRDEFLECTIDPEDGLKEPQQQRRNSSGFGYDFFSYSTDFLDSPWLETTDAECSVCESDVSRNATDDLELSWIFNWKEDDGVNSCGDGFLYSVDMLDNPWLRGEGLCVRSASTESHRSEGANSGLGAKDTVRHGEQCCDSQIMGSPGTGVVRKPDALRHINNHTAPPTNKEKTTRCAPDFPEEYSRGLLREMEAANGSLEAALLSETSIKTNKTMAQLVTK